MRPSSLNYKISLLEAVNAFMQKDKGADQQIEVELEEPTNKNRMNFDVLDDALYNINRASVIAAQINHKNANANTAQKGKAGTGQNN